MKTMTYYTLLIFYTVNKFRKQKMNDEECIEREKKTQITKTQKKKTRTNNDRGKEKNREI